MTLIAKGYGKDLRMMRKESGVTQAELATAMGLSTTTISKIEIGLQQPSLDQLFLWASSCGFTAKIFFSRKDQS